MGTTALRNIVATHPHSPRPTQNQSVRVHRTLHPQPVPPTLLPAPLQAVLWTAAGGGPKVIGFGIVG